MTTPRRHLIVGLGEILWDRLPAGPQLGGAPANFAIHASQLGSRGALVSCVGADRLGSQAIEALDVLGVETTGVGRSSLPTGTVEVSLDENGQASYAIAENVAWDRIYWHEQLGELATNADAVCFGTLAQRCDDSRQTIHQFLRSMRSDALRILDVNLRAPNFDSDTVKQSIELANVVKLSEEELPAIAEYCGLLGSESEMLQQLLTRYNLRLVALTCGGRGAVLVDAHQISQQQAYPTTIVDTVGAGDAYAAALAAGLLCAEKLPAINDVACRIAAYVCSQSGATPHIPDELIPWHTAVEE